MGDRWTRVSVPAVGRCVHYWMMEHGWVAATITKVVDVDKNVVELAVFPPGGMQGWGAALNVEYGESVGKWRWPPLVPDKLQAEDAEHLPGELPADHPPHQKADCCT